MNINADSKKRRRARTTPECRTRSLSGLSCGSVGSNDPCQRDDSVGQTMSQTMSQTVSVNDRVCDMVADDSRSQLRPWRVGWLRSAASSAAPRRSRMSSGSAEKEPMRGALAPWPFAPDADDGRRGSLPTTNIRAASQP